MEAQNDQKESSHRNRESPFKTQKPAYIVEPVKTIGSHPANRPDEGYDSPWVRKRGG